ncbi:MAG: hypothetical protein H7123_06655, partial [Thermoleophilia bacterium]|nr:hypothetical protein [Thermoleophilia bacterium]
MSSVQVVGNAAHDLAAARASAADVAKHEAEPLRAAIFYTKGKALGGTATDDVTIMNALQQKGLQTESIDLADLSHTPE